MAVLRAWVLAVVAVVAIGASAPPVAAAPGAITEFFGPTPFAVARGMTTGWDGALRFTELDAGRIGRIDLVGRITEYALPTPGVGPLGIVWAPDGNIWFTESSGNKIGRTCRWTARRART
ncbi:MAG: virginiamycin B lyase family protein [Acidimicrobiales bacterium]